MNYSKGLIAAGLLAMASVANAGDFSATVTAVSDYDFRGVSLSALDPALQASIDYAAESGIYAGAWVSNYDYGPFYDGDLELDLYAGWATESKNGFTWDVGFVWYTYPDSQSSVTPLKFEVVDYVEIYASVAKGPFKFKQWFTNDYGGSTLDEAYSELSATFPLPADFSLNLHLGYNYGQYFSYFPGQEYLDFSAGVSRSFGHFNVALKVTGTDLDSDHETTDDPFNTEPRAWLSVSTTFPWGDE